MVPPLQFAGWEWLALALATPVVFWSGARLPPRRARERAPRRRDDGHADLDRHARRLDAGRRSCSSAGSTRTRTSRWPRVITTLILLGRYLEARAKRRSGAAIRALLELGAKEARLLRDGEEVLVPVDELQRRRRLRRPPRREDRDRRRRRRGRVGGRPVAADRRVDPGRGRPGAAVAGATVNTYGRLVVRATRVGSETALAQIARLVEQAQTGQGARAAARRPRLGGLRPDRDRRSRWRRSSAGSLAGRRRVGRVHRRGRRPDHRLPVRARPRDADGAAWSAPAAARSSGS